MRASISTKIFLGFTLVIITFCVVSVYSVYKIHRIHGNLRLIKSGYLSLILSLTEVDADLRSYDVVLDERDPDLLVRSVRLAVTLHPFPAIIRRHLGEARRLAADASTAGGLESSEQQALTLLYQRLDALVARLDAFETLSGDLSLAVDERDFERASEFQRRLKNESRILRKEVKLMMLSLREDLDASVLRAERAETSSFWVVVALSVVAVLLSAVVTLLAQLTLEPIRRLTEAVKRVSEGAELGLVEIQGEDEVGILAREFNRMVETLRERDLELRRHERLAIIGRMSAQVAHEVRNPLQSIGLNAELLQEELANCGEGESEVRTLIENIQGEVERLTEVTEDYLRLARLPTPDLQAESLNELVGEVMAFLAPELEKHQVEVELQLSPDLPLVSIDENQVRQALLNLVRNAQEAMEGGGRLSLVTLSDEQAVEFRIRDTGSGISAESLPHIYEPFFSTKQNGTGLGLALTRSIIEAHRGSIRCNSILGAGTEFCLRFPNSPAFGGGEQP